MCLFVCEMVRLEEIKGDQRMVNSSEEHGMSVKEGTHDVHNHTHQHVTHPL